MSRRPPSSTPFPYTTLFRSGVGQHGGAPRRTVGGALRGPRQPALPPDPGLDQRVEPVGPPQPPPHRERARQHLGLRSEEHTSELQSRQYLVCRLLLEKKNRN